MCVSRPVSVDGGVNACVSMQRCMGDACMANEPQQCSELGNVEVNVKISFGQKEGLASDNDDLGKNFIDVCQLPSA